MFFTGHYQNGYVTNDLERAMAVANDRFGLSDYVMFDPANMTVNTPGGMKNYNARMALAWSGGLQIELIQPLNDDTEKLYSDALPERSGEVIARFHHIAVRRPTLDQLRKDVASTGKLLLMDGEVPGFVFYYVDMRQELGHYVEMTWATEEMWSFNKWPANKPAL